MCLVCVELYSTSRPGEKWVQCIQCKVCVREECTDIGFALTFTCQNSIVFQMIMHSSIAAYCYDCNMYNKFVSN